MTGLAGPPALVFSRSRKKKRHGRWLVPTVRTATNPGLCGHLAGFESVTISQEQQDKGLR